jgi:hypothetical protein
MAQLGASNGGLWFLDTHAVLAASDARAMGLDAYSDNPLDILHQRHVYSSWWFALHSLGLTRADYIMVGGAWAFAFLAIALLQLKARSAGEVAWSAALLAAPPIVLGFNRGNADLVVFIVLSAVVPCLMSQHRGLRWLASVPVWVAAALKFYPAVAGIALLDAHRPRREVAIGLLLCVVGGVALALMELDSLQHFFSGNVSPYGYFAFGLAFTVHALPVSPLLTGMIAIGATLAAGTYAWCKAPAWDDVPEPESDRLRFVLGAVIAIMCGIMSENYGYRLVCAVWMAPLLWSAWPAGNWPRWYRGWGRSAGILLLGMMWFDGLARLGLAALTTWPLHPGSTAIRGMIMLEQPLFIAWLAVTTGLLTPWVRDSLRRLVAPLAGMAQ